MHQIIFLIICMVFMVSSYGLSQEISHKFDTIVVTASRTETVVKDAPVNISIITRGEIEENGDQTLTEILKREPGLFTNNLLNNPKSSTVDIRGYGETAPQNVLFLVDGRRINSIDNSGPDLSQITPGIIERIEIYRGPASVLYGDNAVGGVVNIILRKGEGRPLVKLGMTAGSDNLYKPQLTLSGKEKKFSYFLTSSMTDTDGYRHNNNLNSKDIFGNFSFDLLNNLALVVKAGHHRDNYGMPGDLLRGDLLKRMYSGKDSDEPFNSGSTEDNFIDMDTRIKAGEQTVISLNGSYRNRHIASYFTGAGWFSDGKSSLETFSFTPKITNNISFSEMKNTLIAGFDYYTYPTSSDIYGGTWSYSTSRIKKTDYGFYINDKLFLSPKLSLEAGYRVHKAHYDLDYVDYVTPANSYEGSTQDQIKSYRLSANYTHSSMGTFFLAYAKGFRFPTTDEFVAFDPTLFRSFFNPFLKPQTTKELDAGWRWSATKNVRGSLALFRAINYDEIYYNPFYSNTFFGWVGRNENYDRTKRQGLELSIFYQVTEALSLNGSYSYTEAKFDGGPLDGKDIPLVPRNKATSRISYTAKDWNLNLTSVYVTDRYAASDQRNSAKKLPGYVTFDTSFGYTYKNCKGTFTITNLLDKEYYEYGVYSPSKNDIGLYPSAGRRFILGLEYFIDM
ncbi:MAG: TonB-dependent receptor [Syntrophorhabdaceae bacterium]|nr:TonB-dependent receptor [Syntrophorhabdaceae bacterium]MDD5243867.1 TonB-dependent receptor [Syntrophorhabdaceae bacterium]